MISWSGCFFSNPCSSLMELITSTYDYVMMFISSIMVLVIYSMLFLKSINYFNTNLYENHQLESTWTITPFFILLMIIIPSLNSLYMLDSCMFCGLPVTIIGHQWYWSYFINEESISFDSFMSQNTNNSMRLLEADNSLVLPFSTPIRCMLSSSDVIHSWTVPSLGVKMDAIPGRANNFCFSCKRPGVFYGQCSEICGVNHSFMPINMESVSLEDFFNMTK